MRQYLSITQLAMLAKPATVQLWLDCGELWMRRRGTGCFQGKRRSVRGEQRIEVSRVTPVDLRPAPAKTEHLIFKVYVERCSCMHRWSIFRRRQFYFGQ
jgi:hypothetical protein